MPGPTRPLAGPHASIPAVAESWARIDAWTAEHTPVSHALLNPPVTAVDLAAAEAVVGIAFPGHVRESLACHDGLSSWGHVLPGKQPLSAREIAAHWSSCTTEMEDEDLEDDEEPWWHPLWIPWAELGGDSQVVDLRPGPGYGRLGVAVHDDRGHFDDAWPDLASYLHAVAEALDNGGEVKRRRPYLTGEGELWWSRPDRAELGGKPLTPAPRR